MIYTTETWLAIGIVVLYLYDCAYILCFNEFLLEEYAGRWNYICPSDNLRVGRKFLVLGNPLTPDVATLRLIWPGPAMGSSESIQAITDMLQSLWLLRHLVNSLFWFLVVGLPLVVLVQGTGLLFLIYVAIVYLVIIGITAELFRKRAALGMSWRTWSGLISQAFLCPPFAINIVRKITLSEHICNDPLKFSKCLLSRPEFLKLVREVGHFIEQSSDILGSETGYGRDMQRYRVELDKLCQ